jgi:diadenosine tetraphosphate (Ap4A) HIT family hydrolase
MPLEKRKEYARRVVRGLSCVRRHLIDVPAEHMVSYEGSRLTWRQPEVTIRETLHFVALVPERMRTDFAVAIVPKRLVSTYVDLTKDESEDLILLVRLMAQAIESVCEPHGLNTWCESGAAADQKFSHMMLEMVPRRADVPYRYRPLDDVPSAPLAARAKIAERLRTWLKDHTAGAIEK